MVLIPNYLASFNQRLREAYTSIDGFTKPIRMQREGEAGEFLVISCDTLWSCSG